MKNLNVSILLAEMHLGAAIHKDIVEVHYILKLHNREKKFKNKKILETPEIEGSRHNQQEDYVTFYGWSGSCGDSSARRKGPTKLGLGPHLGRAKELVIV